MITDDKEVAKQNVLDESMQKIEIERTAEDEK